MQGHKSVGRRIVAAGWLLTLLAACGGGASSSAGGGSGAGSNAAVTGVGTPEAPPARATIGSSGGMLTSSDGLLTLSIPSGALAQDTVIGIQPIDNQAPGGLGSAYRLTPDGQTFAAPVTLTYSPAGGQPDGSTLSELGTAFQTGDGTWQVLPGGSADNAAGTYTATTTHFTDYSFFAYLDLQIDKSAAFVGQTRNLQVVQYDPVQVDNGPVGAVYLPDRSHPHDFKALSPAWSVNGTPQPGDDTPQGSIVTLAAGSAHYLAPPHLPTSGNPVAVAATFTLPDGGPSVTLVKNVHLLAHRYHVVDNVEFSAVCGPVGGVIGPLDYDLSDFTSFDISLDDDFQITGSNFAAMPPGGPFSVTVNRGCLPPEATDAGESETASYLSAQTDAFYAMQASGGFVEALGKLHLIVTGGEITDIPAYHYVISASGQTIAEGDVPQSRAPTDLEGIFLDGYDHERTPDDPPLPDNPNYVNNTVLLSVLQE